MVDPRHTPDLDGDRRRPAPPLASMLPSAECFPVAFDPASRGMDLVNSTRQAIRQAAFLVPHLMAGRPQKYRANVDDLSLADVGSLATQGPVHYVFISALCCSTLLARYLDMIPGCVVFREPGALGHLALWRLQPAPRRWSEIYWDRSDWERWTSVCLSLTARIGVGDRLVIVKGTDLCNVMVDTIMSHDERSKAILLSVDLRTFILSMLKSEGRRAWLRGRVRLWRRYMRADPVLGRLDPAGDAEGSAYVWLVTQSLWRRQTATAGTGRFMPLDGGTVSEAPATAIKAINRFLALGLSEADVLGMTDSGAAAKHSKSSKRAYGAATRARDVARWEALYGNVADRAISWLAERAEIPKATAAGGPA